MREREARVRSKGANGQKGKRAKGQKGKMAKGAIGKPQTNIFASYEKLKMAHTTVDEYRCKSVKTVER